jgi:hypothetical protein
MRFLLLLALCPLLLAQEQPQLVWEGQVDGASLLRVRGNRIDLEERQGLPVQRQRFRFFERLPDSRLSVRLAVVEGRGEVRILEQPRLENNYTLAVLIDDRQGGSSFYSLAFYWESRGGFFPPSPRGTTSSSDRMESLTWSGRVDDEAVVSCRREECVVEAARGAGVTRDRFRFSRALPSRDTQVSLDRTEGRGQIRLLQQPREENGYTAQVGIRDPSGGAGDYSFTLVWARPTREEPGSAIARRGLLWSGRVDGRVRVIVEGSSTQVEVLTGAPVANPRAEFSRALPARNNPDATVRRLRGRGRVEILEFPSARNGYRLIFEIDDSGGGAADYEVEVGW